MTIQSFRDEMLGIQQFVILKDKEIKKQASRVEKASRETVDLDGLHIKIFGKYLKFLQNKVLDEQQAWESARSNRERVDKYNNDKGRANVNTIGAASAMNHNIDDTSVHMSSYPVQHSALNTQKALNKGQTLVRNVLDQNQNAGADLNTSVMTVSSRYRHENQNSIYYLRPNSSEIYMLVFSKMGFVQEQLKWKRGRGSIPSQFTTVQTMDSNIYVVGGSRQVATQATILADTLMIDANMTVYEREPMKTARFLAPLALVRDRFVLALGGFTSRTSATKSAECYDTYTNSWFNIASLPGQAVNTAAVVMNERWVYLMPGANREMQAGNVLSIAQMDTGSQSEYTGDKNSNMYGAVIAR